MVNPYIQKPSRVLRRLWYIPLFNNFWQNTHKLHTCNEGKENPLNTFENKKPGSQSILVAHVFILGEGMTDTAGGKNTYDVHAVTISLN